jgi:hypothetical protein
MLTHGVQTDFHSERRNNDRRHRQGKALVVTNSGRCSQNATILNVSSTGALVQLDGFGGFSDDFQLLFDGRKVKVTRVWSRGLKAGVLFAS